MQPPQAAATSPSLHSLAKEYADHQLTLNNVEEIFGLQRKSSWALRTAHGICTLPNGKVDTRDIIRAFEAERGLCPVVSRAPGGLGYFGRSSCQRCQSCGVSSSVGLEGGGGI